MRKAKYLHILTNAAKTNQPNSSYPERERESGLTIDIQKWIPASYYSKKLEAVLKEKDSKN